MKYKYVYLPALKNSYDTNTRQLVDNYCKNAKSIPPFIVALEIKTAGVYINTLKKKIKQGGGKV